MVQEGGPPHLPLSPKSFFDEFPLLYTQSIIPHKRASHLDLSPDQCHGNHLKVRHLKFWIVTGLNLK